MGWRPEERSSSDVRQWAALLRRLLGHFAISTTSVECYGLSHACFYLRLSSNVTTRVWIDNLYHIKPDRRSHLPVPASTWPPPAWTDGVRQTQVGRTVLSECNPLHEEYKVRNRSRSRSRNRSRNSSISTSSPS